MNLRVKRAAFSRLVWEEILEFAEQRANCREQLARINEELENLRERADYNTGTLSMSASWCTFAIGEYFRPQTVLEVGTFIGRSTVAMAWRSPRTTLLRRSTPAMGRMTSRSPRSNTFAA